MFFKTFFSSFIDFFVHHALGYAKTIRRRVLGFYRLSKVGKGEHAVLGILCVKPK